MAVERPTFHESWYRVAGLHPRLRSTVQITRQFFRNQDWHVVQDHTNNAFFRLSEPAYRFIGLLDGKRPVGEAWRICNEQLGDDAPTQGEAIQLLGQLYTSNLLMAELPSDTHTLFNRYKKRKSREVQNYLMNLMFIRIPLVDPDAWLERWLPLVKWIFSPWGLIVWAILIGIGLYNLMEVPDWTTKVFDQANGVLAPGNLFLLYFGFALTKACHEMGHAIACKKFGKQSGTGGEVHTIGIMFLIFTPVPYVDASSAWAFTNKWHRVIVGAAGMWVELAIASIAAVVWAKTGEGMVHALAYNMMFVASVSTVLFNANPLLRYDGYYMLSDLLEIPNLAQRGKEFWYYLIKKYAWNVRFARNPAYSTGEQLWLFFYAIASSIMRIVVSFGILIYLAGVLEGALIIIASIMAVAAVFAWILVPIGKFTRYLATNGELARVRPRAILTTIGFVALLLGGLGLIPAPDHSRAQGVVEPLELKELYMGEPGKINLALASLPTDPNFGMPTAAKNQRLLTGDSPDLQAELEQLQAQKREYTTRQNMAFSEDPAKAAALLASVNALNDQIAFANKRLSDLELKAPIAGAVISDDLEYRGGSYLKRGEPIARIADVGLDNLIIRCAVPNELSGTLEREAQRRVEIRVMGRPDILLTGNIYYRAPAGQDKLPSAALGYGVGGDIQTDRADPHGMKTTENVFEIRIRDLQFVHKPGAVNPLMSGQRVLVRFDFHAKPYLYQGWTALQQLFQKKFHG